jgi:hypothetical protein
MVLDAGRIVSPPLLVISFFMINTLRLTMTAMSFSQVEFDKPSELLKKENGRFRSLVDKSSDKDLLYQQANMAAGTSR